MSANANATPFDTLTPIQAEVLKALVEGATVTAAAAQAGVHRSTVHLWTRDHPAFARALLAARQDRADALLDELSNLSQLACDTFRQLLSDPHTPAATRLKAAMEIVKLVQAQRPTDLAKLKADQQIDRFFADFHLAEVASAAADATVPNKEPVRNAPCSSGDPATQTRAA
jgi:transposase-like protein